MLINADKKYELVENNLDFIMDKNTYLDVYRYTIIKSFDVALKLDFDSYQKTKKDYSHDESFEQETSKKYTFDDELYLSHSDQIMIEIEKYYSDNKLQYANVINFNNTYNLIRDTTTKRDLLLLKRLFIYSYRILVDIFLHKAEKYEKKVILEERGFDYFYLPIETDCTISYFIHRYISPIEYISPFDMGGKVSFNKYDKDMLSKQLAFSENASYELISSESFLAISRKSDILKALGVSDNSKEMREDQNHLKLVKLLVDLERNNSLRLQNLLNEPSAESMPYQSHSLLKKYISFLMGELYKEFSVSQIHCLIENQIESYFCMQLGESKNSIIPFTFYKYTAHREKYYSEFIELMKSASAEFQAELHNKDLYNSLVTPPSNCIEKMVYKVMVFKNLSLLNEKITVYKYLIENQEKFNSSFSLALDSPVNQIVYLNKEPEEQLQCFEDIKTLLKNNGIKISKSQIEKFHDSIDKIYKNMWGDVQCVRFIDYLAALLVVHSLKTKEFPLFKYTPFLHRRDIAVFKEAYITSPQAAAIPKTIMKHKIYPSEESHLILKMIDAQKLLMAGFDAFELYEIFKADFEKIMESYNNEESIYDALDSGNKVVQMWAQKMMKVAKNYES